jgi:hypothetical protein
MLVMVLMVFEEKYFSEVLYCKYKPGECSVTSNRRNESLMNNPSAPGTIELHRHFVFAGGMIRDFACQWNGGFVEGKFTRLNLNFRSNFEVGSIDHHSF